MDETTVETGPTNPYARIFFWLWSVVLLISLGFRTEDPAYREQLDGWHRQRAPFATYPLPPKQNRLAVRIPVGEKLYGHH